MNLKHIQIITIVFVLFITGCAKQSSPVGGPKDTEPPVALRSSPVNYSTNFKGKKFIVEFDEFIDLKNVNQELIVSPPLEKKPKVLMRGKKMVVTINNQLADSTTYNFNFFNSITDLNEGNVLENFQFEFSTGSSFDSIYLGGRLLGAFDCNPIENAYILLYRSYDDSIPRKTKPECVGKTNKDGYFIVPNMRDVPYYIFALKDMNNNMLFDLPNEAIAFCDSVFRPTFKPAEFTDTLRIIESISKNKKDTVFRDSIYTYTVMVTTIDDIKLNMFTEEHKIQYLHGIYRKQDRLCSIAFNSELDESFSFKLISDSTYNENWYQIEGEQPTDSVVFWITDSTIYKKDTIKIAVSYLMTDTVDYVRTDTLDFIFDSKQANKEKASKDKKKRGNNLLTKIIGEENTDNADKEEKRKESELKINHNMKEDFDLNQPVKLTMKYPIKHYSAENVKFVRKEEENEYEVDFTIEKDSVSDRIFNLKFSPKEASKYYVEIPEGSFTDIYGNTNDTLKTEFFTRGSEYYSSIIMNLSGVKNPNCILQLLNAKEKVLEEHKVTGNTTITINYLSPGTYKCKLIYDDNGNGVWDTGNYKERRQPEKVFYFGRNIETKSGWDMEYTWIVE